MATTTFLEALPDGPRFCSTPIPSNPEAATAPEAEATTYNLETTVIYKAFIDQTSGFSASRTRRLMPALRQARISASEALEKVGKLATTVHAILDQTRLDPTCIHFIEIRRRFQHLGNHIKVFAERLYRVVFGYFGRALTDNDSESWLLPAEIENRLRDLDKQIAKVCDEISCQRLHSVVFELKNENYDLGDFPNDLTEARNLCLGPQ